MVQNVDNHNNNHWVAIAHTRTHTLTHTLSFSLFVCIYIYLYLVLSLPFVSFFLSSVFPYLQRTHLLTLKCFRFCFLLVFFVCLFVLNYNGCSLKTYLRSLIARKRKKKLITGEFPSQRPVTRSFDVSIDLRLSKRLRNHRYADNLRRHRVYYDVTVMITMREPCVYLSRYRVPWITKINWKSLQ